MTYICDMIISKEDIIKKSVPSKRKQIIGVYFLINKHDEIVYVGSGLDIMARILMHKKDGAKVFNRYFIIEVEEAKKDQRKDLEKYYIQQFLPIYNKQCNPKYKRLKTVGADGKFGYGYKSI